MSEGIEVNAPARRYRSVTSNDAVHVGRKHRSSPNAKIAQKLSVVNTQTGARNIIDVQSNARAVDALAAANQWQTEANAFKGMAQAPVYAQNKADLEFRSRIRQQAANSMMKIYHARADADNVAALQQSKLQGRFAITPVLSAESTADINRNFAAKYNGAYANTNGVSVGVITQI